MKKIIVLTLFLILGLNSCQDYQVKERERIKAFSERFFVSLIQENSATIGKSQFWEKSQFPNTYSIIIRFLHDKTIDDIKKMVWKIQNGAPGWSILYDWTYDVDRYSTVFYDTASDIAITYGFIPDKPSQLAFLVCSYSDLKKTTE